MVAEIDEFRWGCGVAAVGSKIYLFGGGAYSGEDRSNWNAFDVGTGQWASASIPVEKRKLSDRDLFSFGGALTVPSSLDNGKRMTWDD